MKKEEFLKELSEKLSGLPKEDLEERITFYNEMIDDRMEDGISEDEAVSGIGTVEEIVGQIMAETPLATLVKEKVRPKRELKAWEIILLALGSVVWVPLVLALMVVILSVYVVIWSAVISFYAADLSLLAGFIGCFGGIFMYIAAGKMAGAAFAAGAALVCAGLSIFMFFVCVWITKGVIKLTGKMLIGIKTAIVGK